MMVVNWEGGAQGCLNLAFLNSWLPARCALRGTQGSQTVIEAEASSNTLTGTAAVSSCSTCSGGNDVRLVGGNQGTLQFNTVPADVTSSDAITIAYINGDGSARTASMSVNGGAASTVSFPPTGSWTTVGTITLIVNLNTGNNTIKFFNTSSWAPDFDKLTVGVPQTPTGTKYEAEASANTLAGTATITSCSTCSGGYAVYALGTANGSSDSLQFNNVSVSTTGTYRLVISYLNGDTTTTPLGLGSSRTASMSINGGTAITVSFPSTGDWSEIAINTLTVPLQAGNNTILFSNSSSPIPNIDKIDVT